jgi:phosphotransferase system enzyme I (PtsI)
MKKLQGIGASGGIAIGGVFLLRSGEIEVAKNKITDVGRELERLEEARDVTVRQLEEIYQKSLKKLGEESSMIFQIHIMMVQDEDFHDAVTQEIRSEQTGAEYAVWLAGQQFSRRFAEMDDAYMRGRAQDVIDIARRWVRNLRGSPDSVPMPDKPCVVCAADLTPSETVQMDKKFVLAFVTGSGSKTSHSAILARTLGIPSVVGLGSEAFGRLHPGETVIVDGSAGAVFTEPGESELLACRKKQAEDLARKKELKKLIAEPAAAKDGTRIRIYANIGHPNEADAALENGAEGIGLFRSEFLYMENDSLPDEETQFSAYRSVLEKMGDRPVIIRTFDIGADKKVPYLDLPEEANPALGFRAIRICLARPELFMAQLRALYRASAAGNLSIMFPMIASSGELAEAKKMAAQARRELKEKRIPFSPDVKLGIMVETPAAAVLSEELAKEADFFSIGTNDLTQYTLAADRMNPTLAPLYDQRHPAVLSLMKTTFRNAKKAGIPAGVCGESAADPSLTQFYLQNRVDELSVSPSSVLELKKAIRDTQP